MGRLHSRAKNEFKIPADTLLRPNYLESLLTFGSCSSLSLQGVCDSALKKIG